MTGWQEIKFGDLLIGGTRNGVYKPKEFHGRGDKIVNMGELFAYPRLFSVPMKRVEISENEQKNSRLQEGDLIFARRSLVAEGAGKCTIICEVTEPTTFESSIIRARPNPNLANSFYLYYFFNSSLGMHKLDTIRRQVAVSGITGTDLVELPIPTPPLKHQMAIAAVLGVLDDKIELNSRMNATLEAAARALFKSWFVDFDPVKAKMALSLYSPLEGESKRTERPIGWGVNNSAEIPPTASLRSATPPQGGSEWSVERAKAYLATMDAATAALFPARLTESELGDIPEGWEVKKFEDFIERLPSGKKYDQKNTTTTGKIPVLDQGKSGVIGYHDNEPDIIADKENPLFVFANHTCYMRWVYEPSSAIQNVIPLRGKNLPIYWAWYATVDVQKFQEYKGHWPDFAIKKAIIPDADSMKFFSDIVKPFVRKQFENLEEIKSLERTRDYLLPKLISGEIRIPDAEKFVEGLV